VRFGVTIGPGQPQGTHSCGFKTYLSICGVTAAGHRVGVIDGA